MTRKPTEVAALQRTSQGKMLPSRQKGGVKHRDIKDSMTTMGYTLETPSNGNNTGYTVITGDSIASGEGASFAGTYLKMYVGKTRQFSAAWIDAYQFQAAFFGIFDIPVWIDSGGAS